MRNADRRFQECRNRPKCVEAREDVQRVRNRVAEVGLEYFCQDYVSTNGVSVMERNTVVVNEDNQGRDCGVLGHVDCERV